MRRGLHLPDTALPKMPFRARLIAAFLAALLPALLILTLQEYRFGVKALSELAGNSVGRIVTSTNRVVDGVFFKAREMSNLLVSDAALFDLFKAMGTRDSIDLLAMDRSVSRIIGKYTSSMTEVRSVVIATRYYTFGNNTSVIAPANYAVSSLYRDVQAAEGALVWIPTYDFTVMFRHPELSGISAEQRLVFSAARRLDCYALGESQLSTLGSGIERPTLIVTYAESYLSQAFRDSVPIQGTEYYVLAPDGRIVSGSDKTGIGRILERGWRDTVLQKRSGVSIAWDGPRKVILGYDSSEITGWTTVAVVPFEELNRTIAPQMRRSVLLVAALALILSVVLVMLVSVPVSRSAKLLITAMQDVGEGDFERQIPLPARDEFGAVIFKFNQMSQRIRRLIQENYEATIRRKEAEIAALKLQLNPHFVCNALSAVNWMALDAGQADISALVTSITEMLSYTLREKEETARLSDDMEWLKRYVSIMSRRHAGGFSVRYDIDARLEGMRVPRLFLQPFVENSIMHGFASLPSSYGCLLAIAGRLDGAEAEFTVKDNGAGMSLENAGDMTRGDSGAVGVSNVDRRIKLLYGSGYGVAMKSRPGVGTLVTIRLPFQEADVTMEDTGCTKS